MSNFGYSGGGTQGLRFISVVLDQESGEIYQLSWESGEQKKSIIGYTQQSVQREAEELLSARSNLETELKQLKQGENQAASLVEAYQLLQTNISENSKKIGELADLVAMLFDLVEGQKNGHRADSS